MRTILSTPIPGFPTASPKDAECRGRAARGRCLRGREAMPLVLLHGVACLLLSACTPIDRQPPRNVFVVVVDCLRADFLGVVGAQFPATPSIDALAREGVWFDEAFAQAGWTRPSLHSLMTGLYPSEHGIKDILDKSDPEKPKGRRLSAAVMTVAEAFHEAGWTTALVGNQVQLDPAFGLDQGFSRYEHRAGDTRAIADRFIDWVDANRGQRLFAYLHFLELHWPYCPRDARGRFSGGEPLVDYCDAGRDYQARLRTGAVELDAPGKRAFRARYAEELSEIDAGLGRLFVELRARELWSESLIVLTSDHGEEFFEHGGAGHGHSLYDELLRVPYVWKLPDSWRVPAGRAIRGPVETRTLAPTLLSLVGGTPPNGSSALDLAPWLLGDAAEPAGVGEVVAETVGAVAVRTPDWKLVWRTRENRGKLYDLIRDPGEQSDVSASAPATMRELTGRLRRWRRGLRPIGSDSTAVDDSTIEGLRSLGYLEVPAAPDP